MLFAFSYVSAVPLPQELPSSYQRCSLVCGTGQLSQHVWNFPGLDLICPVSCITPLVIKSRIILTVYVGLAWGWYPEVRLIETPNLPIIDAAWTKGLCFRQCPQGYQNIWRQVSWCAGEMNRFHDLSHCWIVKLKTQAWIIICYNRHRSTLSTYCIIFFNVIKYRPSV